MTEQITEATESIEAFTLPEATLLYGTGGIFESSALAQAVADKLNSLKVPLPAGQTGSWTINSLATYNELDRITALGDQKSVQNVTSLEGIQSLRRLTNLSIGAGTLAAGAVQDLTPLAAREDLATTNPTLYSRMQYLYLTSNRLAEIAPLSSLTELRVLSLGTNWIADLNQVTWSNFTQLRELYLSSNRITTLDPLSNLAAEPLQILSVGSNKITSLEPVARFTNLRELYAAENKITDLAPIAGLTNLQILSLGNNQLASDDLTHLAKLTNLTQLWLGRNQITEISALAPLVNLTKLYLANNQLQDPEAAQGDMSVLINGIPQNLQYQVLAPLDSVYPS